MNDAQPSCPWDPERLDYVTSSPERAWAILELLLQQGEKTLARMQGAQEDSQATEWRHAAHGLAGSALNLGMARLASYCREDLPSTATAEQRYELREAIRAELMHIATYKSSLNPT